MSDRSMKVGEVSMECNGKAGFAGFAFRAARRKWRLVEPKTDPKAKTATRAEEEGAWLYTHQNPGAEMEILA